MRSFQHGTIAIFAFILILNHVQSFRPSYKQKKSITSLQMSNNKGKSFVKFLSISAISFFLNVDINDMKQVSIISSQPASADSTGKMSTKLTARKRYLPRVKAGVTEFSKLSLDSASVTTFSTDSVSFVRAMDLYGVSMRKGETPDNISRQAKELTENFAKEIKKLENIKEDDKIKIQYKSCLTALDSYLEYVKLPISSDSSYVGQVVAE